MFLPWQYREDDAWTLDSKTQTQAQITLSEEKNEINADKTDTMNIDRGGHTYTCYVSAILAYIPFGCLHYRSHYFVPNLYWTNLQSEQQQKKNENQSNVWVRTTERPFMDSMYRLIQLNTELSPYCLCSSLDIWPHVFLSGTVFFCRDNNV